jgi:tetratricopeptide (TPR) repeat protein
MKPWQVYRRGLMAAVLWCFLLAPCLNAQNTDAPFQFNVPYVCRNGKMLTPRGCEVRGGEEMCTYDREIRGQPLHSALVRRSTLANWLAECQPAPTQAKSPAAPPKLANPTTQNQPANPTAQDSRRIAPIAAPASASTQTKNPPYLAQFPSVERVKSEMQGKDAMDTAARQMGAFWQLQEIIKGMSGLRWTTNALTPDEKELLGQYAAGYQTAGRPYASYPDRPAWYKMHAFYETNRDFRDELFRRLLTPAIQAHWAQITGDTRAQVEASKAQRQAQATQGTQPSTANHQTAPSPEDLVQGVVSLIGAVNSQMQAAEGYATAANDVQAKDIWQRVLRESDTFKSKDEFTIFFSSAGRANNMCHGTTWIPDHAYTVMASGGRVVVAVKFDSATWLLALKQDGTLVSQNARTLALKDGKSSCAVDVLTPERRAAATTVAGAQQRGAKDSGASVPAPAKPAASAQNTPPAHSSHLDYARDAMYALAAKNYDKAIEAYKKAVEMDPSFDEMGLLIFLRLNQDAGIDVKAFDEAENQLKQQWPIVLKRHVATHPNDAIAFLILGDAHKLWIDEKTMPPVVVQAHRKDALTAYRQAKSLKASPVVLANTAIRMANTYQALKDNDSAVASFREALNLQPDNQTALVQLGHSLYELKKYPGALEAYEKYRRLNPKAASYYVGMTLNAMKQYEKAVPVLQEQLRAAPRHADASYELGVAYRELTQYSNAVSAFQQAIQLKGKEPYPDAVFGLGLTYLKMGQRDQASQVARRLESLDKAKGQQLREQIGGAATVQPAPTKGSAASRPEAEKQLAGAAAAYVKDGDAYSAKSAYPKAIESYKKALALDVNNGDAHWGLGAALYQQKRFAEALQPLQRAVRLKPDDNNVLWVLGCTYVELGNKQQALRIYRTLVARAKDDVEKQDAAELMARIWEKFPELKPN